MNDTYIVTVYVVMDDLLKLMNYQEDVRAKTKAAEILTLAVVAAKYFANHHERAVGVLSRLGYVKSISLSRFSRRLHNLLRWVEGLVELVGYLFSYGKVFIIDTLPLPVCKSVRAKRCHKVRGKLYEGYCASKKAGFFGWRCIWCVMYLVYLSPLTSCPPDGMS